LIANLCRDDQSLDLAMTTIKTRTFPARFSSLAAISEFIAQGARSAKLDDRAAYAVQMAVDEACSNIIEYAYPNQTTGEIICSYEVTPRSLIVTLGDRGDFFDPTQAPEPDVEALLQDRPDGGLGTYFIRKLVDRVEHEFSPGRGNVLTLFKRRE
jgi:serine/threonine-protein kinase RsbW